MRRRFLLPLWLEWIILGVLVITGEHLAVFLKYQITAIGTEANWFKLGLEVYAIVALAAGVFIASLWNLLPVSLKANPILWSVIGLALSCLWWGVYIIKILLTTNWDSGFTDM